MGYSIESFLHRMSLIEDIGLDGIRKLSKSRVAIIGLGGLGSHLALYLGLSGVGRLKLVDPDIIEFNNLHRQILYTVKDVGLYKVEVARDKLSIYAPYTDVVIYPMMLTPWNVDRIFRDVDIILDGSDNLLTRYLINRYSIKSGKPYIYTAVEGDYISITFLNPPKTPCLECFMKSRDIPRVIPIMETTVSAAAAVEAREAIKYIVSGGSSLINRLLTIDLKRLEFEYIPLVRDPDCKVCRDPDIDALAEEQDFDLFYWGGDIIFNPREKIRLDLEPLTRRIAEEYPIYRRGRVGVTFYYNKHLVGVSYSGNMIVKDVSDKDGGVKIIESLVDIFREYVID